MQLHYYIDANAFKPTKAHRADAGIDIRTPIAVEVLPHNSITIDTGVHIAIPEGFVGFLKSKSGLNVHYGLQGEGVIDAGYTGSIVVKIYNHSGESYYFDRGDKIIQLVILPIPDIEMIEVAKFESTERGNNGFGSTGK